jgi:hypothetical protein
MYRINRFHFLFRKSIFDRFRPFSSLVRVVGGVAGGAVNLVPSAPAPTFFYMALCDGGPPTMARLGAPDQSVDQGPDSAVGPSREEINLTGLRYCPQPLSHLPCLPGCPSCSVQELFPSGEFDRPCLCTAFEMSCVRGCKEGLEAAYCGEIRYNFIGFWKDCT